MTYQEFKDYLVAFLWKSGDTVLIDNLDNLIRQGENLLNRELNEDLRYTSTTLSVVSQTASVPSDYEALRSISDLDGDLGEFEYERPAKLRARRAAYSSGNWQPFYSVVGQDFLFCGTDNRDLTLDYKRKIPVFATADASWLTDDNLDLLTYATLYHTATFLREDERVPTWQGLYTDIIGKIDDSFAHSKQRGTYGTMPLPRSAAGRTRTGLRRTKAHTLHTKP